MIYYKPTADPFNRSRAKAGVHRQIPEVPRAVNVLKTETLRSL